MATKLIGWKVLRAGVWIDTVYYRAECDAEYVLFCETQYEKGLTVERVNG